MDPASVTGRASHPRVAMMLGSDGPGGAEMMVFRLSEELRRRGCHVVPIGPAVGVGWLGNLFREAGFEPQTYRLGRSWLDTTCIRDLRRLYRAHDIDVVHGHEFDMAFYGALSTRFTRLPHIITMHGGLTAAKAIQRRVALRWAMRRAACTVAVSEATRGQFSSELGVPGAAFTVIPNGVPSKPGDASAVRAEFGVADGDTVLLAVGTLERNKGHHLMLDALVRLKSAGLAVPWKLIIAGGRGGDQHQALLAFVTAHGLDGRVHIVTGRSDIADLQALADVFVMPSIWEGMPMALLEAMVAGNAIVASATGGIPEAIVAGRDGILVPPGDVDALAQGLKTMLTDRGRRDAFAAAAHQRGLREFTVEVMGERYEAYIHAFWNGGPAVSRQHDHTR